jgi:hypothetical protein
MTVKPASAPTPAAQTPERVLVKICAWCPPGRIQFLGLLPDSSKYSVHVIMVLGKVVSVIGAAPRGMSSPIYDVSHGICPECEKKMKTEGRL